MRANLEMGGGLVYSGLLLLDLAAKGVPRETAYRWVQRNALSAWEGGGDFRALVERDADIASTLTPQEIARAFNLERQLRHVDRIFERVFSRS
jgi:adenylosuccinate lyase